MKNSEGEAIHFLFGNNQKNLIPIKFEVIRKVQKKTPKSLETNQD